MNDSLKNHAHSNPSVSYSDNNGILPRSDSDFDHKIFELQTSWQSTRQLTKKKLMMDKFLSYGPCELLLID